MSTKKGDYSKKRDIPYRLSKPINIEKLDSLIEVLGITKAQALVMCRKNPSLLNADKDSIKNKIENFEKTFEFNRAQVAKICIDEPRILGLGEDSVRSRVENFEKTLGIHRDKTSKLFYDRSSLLTFSEENIQDTAKNLGEKLELDKISASLILTKNTAIFGYSKDNVNSKIENLIKSLGLSRAEVAKICLTLPSILSHGVNPIKAKAKGIKQLNLNTAKVNLLVVHALSLKIRFMLAQLNGMTIEKFEKGACMTGEAKIYARRTYLKSNPNKKIAYNSEKSFAKQFGFDSETLMDMFPLDSKALDTIEAQYALDRHEPPLVFSKEERAHIQTNLDKRSAARAKIKGK